MTGGSGDQTRVDARTFLREIVSIPSLSGRERPVAERICAQMTAWGYDRAFIDEAGNAVGLRQNGPPAREIVLLGHMDTVPGEIPVRIEGASLYGRGTVDAKGPLAAFVAAGARAALLPATRLVVIGATEEEAATSRGARLAAAAYRPDFCLIGEPSGWDGITLGYKGRLLLDYHLARAMGHTAGPETAVAEEAVAFWQEVQAFCRRFNAEKPRLFDQLLPSIRHIESGSDGLTDTVSLKIGFRLPPDFDIDQLKRACREHQAAADLSFYGAEAAFHSGRQNPLYRALSQAIRAREGRPVPKLKTGTSDMNVVGPVWQCPIVAYGPGDSALDHTPHEHLDLEEFDRSIEVLVDVLQNLRN